MTKIRHPSAIKGIKRLAKRTAKEHRGVGFRPPFEVYGRQCIATRRDTKEWGGETHSGGGKNFACAAALTIEFMDITGLRDG